MSGARSRRKGHQGERDIAKVLSSVYPNARRGLQYQPFRNPEGFETPGKVRECDVEGTPFWVECKRGKKCRIKPALEQARRDRDKRMPLAVCRDDNEEAIVSMYLVDFIRYIGLLRDRMHTLDFDTINTEVL